MRKLLLYLLVLFCSLTSFTAIGQNTDFISAEPLNSGETKTGKIVAGQAYYYYKTMLPADGTVRVILQGKHTGGNNGGFQFYVYDKSRRQVENFSIGVSTTKSGDVFTSTVEIYSRAADSLYFLVYHPGGRTFDYTFQYTVLDQSKNDKEPNDSRPNAFVFSPTEKPEGHIGYVADGHTDQYDYYKTLLPANGTLRVYLEAKHTGGNNGSFGFYVYDKQGRQIYGNSAVGKPGAKKGDIIQDTIDVFSRDKDSLYLLIYHPGGRSFNYKFHYEVVSQSANDNEPNNTFEQANSLGTGQVTNGQIGYVTAGVTDQYDYYKTKLPADGTIRVFIEGTHTGGNAGEFGFYAYDKSHRQMEGKSSLGEGTSKMGDTFRDTIDIYSRAADSIYLLIYHPGGRSFSYKLSYQMIDQSINDEEPNDDFLHALSLKEKQIAQGHIGYIADGRTDQNDYYKTQLPTDGTIRVIIEGTHTGGNAGEFGFYAYDNSRRQIEGKSSIGKGTAKMGDTFRDTIDIYSRAADSIYLLIYHPGGRSFSYKLSYQLIDQSINDKEPNDDFLNALSLNEKQMAQGHIGYVADGRTDQNDYYKTKLPTDGTIRVIIEGTHTGGSVGEFGFYAYDKSRRQIEGKSSLGEGTSKMGNTFRDTIDINSRAADSIYFLIYHPGGRSFRYKLVYEMIDTSAVDPEPNGEFDQAVPIMSAVAIKGHIGYVANGITDQYDYYKTLLPADGTVTVYLEGQHTGGNNGSFGFYAYDNKKRQIIVKSSLGRGAPQFGDPIRDTIVIESRAADSLYLLIYHPGGRSFRYTLRYEMPGSLKGDREPNNTFSEATGFKITDSLSGLLGYVQAASTDRNDYYKIAVPERHTVKVFVEAQHTGGGDGSFAFYAYDKHRRQIMVKQTMGNRSFSQGDLIRDTLTIPCVATDSMYILLYQPGSLSLTYDLHFSTVDNKPVAAFTSTRIGNDFGFVNRSKNTNTFSWKFGDGTTSSVSYPIHSYKPGVYNLQLIASNATCNFNDTARQTFSVAGIERFTPTNAGSGGDLNMQIFGGGLDTSARISLKKGNITIPAHEKYDNGVGSMLGVVFDLHFAEKGKYTLEVVFKNGEVIKYDNAFTIESMIYPETYSEIVGPAIWRNGRTANFNLVVGNNGNTVARGVIVVLAWPKAAKLEFYGKQYSPDTSDFIEVKMEEYNETIRSSYGLVKWIYDSINTVTPIDTFKTSAYDGYVRFLYVPVIAPHSTYELPFKLTTTESSKLKLVTYTVKPNQFGSCETFNISTAFTGPASVELMINSLDWAVDELKVPKSTKIPAQIAVKSLKVTQKHIDVSSEVASRRLWASYYNWQYGGGAENHGLTDSEYFDYYKEGLAADEFAKDQLKDIAIDQGINILQLPASKRKTKLTEQIQDNKQALVNKMNDYQKIAGKKTGRTKTWRMKKKEAAREWQNQFEKGEKTLGELTELKNLESIAEWANRTKNAKQELELMIKYIEENCPEHKEALEKLKDELNKETDINREKEKDAETRTSYDPNAIYGPSGFKQARYVNSFDRHPFVIMFENVDTAKADAQFVTITDTIDKTKFDLSTFELGNITIGGRWYRLPKGRQEVMMEINLAPYRNMRVRLNASLDTATGIATWLFTSIDPNTGDLPDLDGFLPPNKDYPSGEGSVTFTVYPRKNLPHGTQLTSRASIIFDFNKPILTNEWTNIVDAQKPTGHILAEIEQDSVVVLNYHATDAESGVDYYNLYVSEDNKEWVSLGGGNYTNQRFIGEPGKTYYFYVEAQDRVGNRERKVAVSETAVTVHAANPGSSRPDGLVVYPVPSNGSILLEAKIPVEQEVHITVFSMTGQRVASLYNGKASGVLTLSKNLEHLRNGVYFVQVIGNKGLVMRKKLLIVK